MMDVFMEHLAPKKRDAKDKVIVAAIIAGGVIVSLAMFALMFIAAFAMAQSRISTMSFSVGCVLVFLLWYGAVLLINTRSVEYEYILTNNELDIDKVMSKKGRKHLISLDLAEAQCIARTDDDEHNSVYKNPPEGVKITDYSAHSENGYTYFIDIVAESERKIILFEPTGKMIDAIWKFNPRNVHSMEG